VCKAALYSVVTCAAAPVAAAVLLTNECALLPVSFHSNTVPPLLSSTTPHIVQYTVSYAAFSHSHACCRAALSCTSSGLDAKQVQAYTDARAADWSRLLLKQASTAIVSNAAAVAAAAAAAMQQAYR
jgi:hypothetical protein